MTHRVGRCGFVRWVVGVSAIVALMAGCASGGSLVVEGSSDVEEMSMVLGVGASGGEVLGLVEAGLDSLSVAWVEGFVPAAAGFRLRWREVPSSGEGDSEWSSVDLSGDTRSYTVRGLGLGTPYRLRLNALDADGGEGALAVATFRTLAPPPDNLTVTVSALGVVRVDWEAPAAWAPAGFVVRWRVRGPAEFLDEVSLGSEARGYAVEGLPDGEYEFRVTALISASRESGPASVGVVVGAGDVALMLTSAGVDSLSLRWVEGFEPAAAGFRLRWRPVPAPDSGTLEWESADVDAGVREFAIGGLAAGTPYVLRLNALDADGGEGALAVATFETLAPPPRNLSVTAVAHDAAQFNWDAPAGWMPVGYVLQWRESGGGDFLGHFGLAPGRRSQTVTGLEAGREYVFRLTARTATGYESDPITVRASTPEAPTGGLHLEVSVASYCIADEGDPRGVGGPSAEDVTFERVNVATVPLQWRLSGGEAPYTLRILGESYDGATGSVEVSCAVAGVDLMNLTSHETSVVEAGPKTWAFANLWGGGVAEGP